MLRLASLATDHLTDVQRYAADPRIAASSHVPTPYPADGALTWYGHVDAERRAGRSEVFAILGDDAFAGVISLTGIDREAGRAQLDYWVAVAWQGRGIATQAAALAIVHADTILHLRELRSTCLIDNHASRGCWSATASRAFGRKSSHADVSPDASCAGFGGG